MSFRYLFGFVILLFTVFASASCSAQNVVNRVATRLAPHPTVLALPTPTLHWEQSPSHARIELAASGLVHPDYLVPSNDGSARLYVLEQEGRIRIVQDGRVLPEAFLDLRGRVPTVREQGLQSMTFAPDYATSGLFYIAYNRKPDGALVLSRYRVSQNPDVADAGSAVEILVVPFGAPDHHGGQLRFGRDGYLYFSVGDGNDPTIPPNDNSQRLDNLYGKILRLDVSRLPYQIPATNPFAHKPNARGEIWAYGLRNPWRFIDDDASHVFYISDVGQWTYEEVDAVDTGDMPGKNFGWPQMEGAHCFVPTANCSGDSFTLPVFEYPHAYGCAIVGGIVYHGEQIPDLNGQYLFGDFCSGRVWAMNRDKSGSWRAQELGKFDLQLSAIAQGSDGNIFLADYGKGNLYRLVVEQ